MQKIPGGVDTYADGASLSQLLEEGPVPLQVGYIDGMRSNDHLEHLRRELRNLHVIRSAANETSPVHADFSVLGTIR